ncbi:MAG: Smr/MutS family protein [Vicinamibacteria bacterium]|nr:Smr/MutS family protein [Vicinamibacteria bacterium]
MNQPLSPLDLTNSSSLKALEWSSICALLVRRATRAHARTAFADFPPGGASRGEVETSLAQVEVFRNLLADGALGFAGIPEVEEICASLVIQGEYLDGLDLLALARFAGASADLGREVEARLDRGSFPNSGFPTEAKDLRRVGDLSFVRSVAKKIGPKGEVRDDASPELRRLRARTNRLREDLDLVFETYLHKPNADDVLQDKVVASRNGRSVLMVKAEAKRSFEGVVHGASRAHKTAFIEPIEAVAVNNELVVVSEEEQEEIRQILGSLSDEARQDLSALQRADWILRIWDSLHAKARLAHDLGGLSPAFSEDGSLVIVRGIHPLLVDRIRGDLDLDPTGREPVSLDLEIAADRKILVIGGPNTGGKTVALKTVGLLCLMARSGLPIPAGEGTTVPFFDSIFAEIGDDQSLGAGLSTFSAQIAGIAKMTWSREASALVLLDELGSGTDPLEGGALGAAILDDFARRGGTVIATTHNADLKLFAQESPIGRCASFAYDPASFAPTYKLVLNQPGRSLAFEIAGRLGVPARVVDQARSRLPETARRQEAILADLAREKAELAENQQRLKSAQAKTAELQETLSNRLGRIETERERMQEDTRNRIHAAREAEDKRLRALFAEAEEKLKNRKTPRAVIRLRTETLSQVTPPSDVGNGPDSKEILSVGDFVLAPALGWRGLITALTDADVEIDSGGKRIRLGRALVQRAKNPKAQGPSRWPATGQGRPDAAEAFATKRAEAKGDSLARSDGGSGGEARRSDEFCPPPLKIIGLRVDEAMPLVDKFLDDAFLADAPSIRIVHGFGQGRLRAAVRDLLRSHPHVTGFRDGAPHEGGAGATVVEVRR